MTADPFPAAIAADPADRTVRLVYADWLEERDDPRHELVRACERMRQVPVYSDEYWHRKARRNELRAVCPADWLAATGYDGSDYDPIFRDGLPDDWRGRWRVVREFTERWCGVPMPDVGGRPEDVRAEEERLGVALPPSVREFVAFAFDVSPSPGSRVLSGGYRMEWVTSQPAIALMVDLGENFQWAVRFTDLGAPDPPVHTYSRGHGLEQVFGFVPHSNDRPVPVSEWVLDRVAAFDSVGSGFATMVWGSDRLRQQLETAFPIHRPAPPGTDLGRYEHPAGLLAETSYRRPDGPHVAFWVRARTGVPWQAVPEFLWEYARRGYARSGTFCSPEEVESELRRRGSRPLPPGGAREAVPPMRLPPVPEEGDPNNFPF